MNFATYADMISALLAGKTIVNTNSEYPDYLKLVNGEVYGKTPALFSDDIWRKYPEPNTYFCWRIA
jgi:hypothetical protein